MKTITRENEIANKIRYPKSDMKIAQIVRMILIGLELILLILLHPLVISKRATPGRTRHMTSAKRNMMRGISRKVMKNTSQK